MTHAGTEALRAHRANVSEQKRLRVIASIEMLEPRTEAVSVSGVARHAGVSREFIHSHHDLLAAVRAARTRQATAPLATPSGPSRLERRLQAETRTLLATIDKKNTLLAQQAEELEALRTQRRRWLGDQLAPSIDPDEHRELRVLNDRLTTDAVALRARVADLERTNAILESDLAASRQAHAESVRELVKDRPGVIPIGRGSTRT